MTLCRYCTVAFVSLDLMQDCHPGLVHRAFSFHLKLCEGLTLNDQHQEASDCSNFGSTEYVLVQLQESAQRNWCGTIVSVDLWRRVWLSMQDANKMAKGVSLCLRSSFA